MSLHAQPLEPIPEQTARIAKASFPKGTFAIQLRDALGPIYQDADFAALFPKRGRAATAPWRLALVTVLQAEETLSDRQAAEMVRARLDWKYALSLPLDDEGFDSTILGDFRQRLVDAEAQDLLLEPILQVCEARGWLKARGQQRTDSTLILANIRQVNSLETVGETLRAALNELADEEPDWLLSVISPDWFDRYVHRFELARFPKSEQAQKQLRQQVGEDSWRLLQAVKGTEVPASVRDLPVLGVLHQVWDQHFERVDEQVRWRDGPSVSNSERILSPYETEARRSKKRSTQWDGYKVHLSETCDPQEAVHLIVQVQTTVATRHDVQETLSIMQQLEEHERAPEKMYVDSGYLSGPTVLGEQQQGRQLLGPIQYDTSWQQHTGYGQTAFELDWEQKQARCPQGQVSASWKETHGNRGEESIQIGFAGRICQACEGREKCTTASKGGRTLTVYPREIHEVLQQRRAEQSSADFQKEYARRAGVESTMSEAVRSHGMRHSRYRGRDKTHLQMVTVAAAINLVRIASMLTRTQKGLPPRKPRAPSPFARLRDLHRSA